MERAAGRRGEGLARRGELVGEPTEACQFCRIVRGLASARVVYETASVVAFFPQTPATLGHTLVVPREHVTDLLVATDAVAADVIVAARDVGRAIRQAMRPQGLNVISSVGRAASQTVFHLHVHVVPRWRGDPMGEIWPPRRRWRRAEQDETAERIRAAFRSRGGEQPSRRPR